MDELTEEELIEELLGALQEERENEIKEYAKKAVEKEIEEAAEQDILGADSGVNGDEFGSELTDPSENEKEQLIMQKQNEIMEEMAAMSEEHLVRGAMLRCKCGSHCRRLNLPLTHGFMEEQRPLMNAEDSVFEENITYFGVCTSPTNQSGAKTILLKKDYERDAFGRKISDETTGNVKGTCCTPIILGSWQNVQDGTLIDGAPAITPSSFLICQYGGIIEVLDSGQHDEETLIGE